MEDIQLSGWGRIQTQVFRLRIRSTPEDSMVGSEHSSDVCAILNLDVVIILYFSFLRVTAGYLLASLGLASEIWP